MVGRVNTERRLVTIVIDIFERFFLHVAQDASLMRTQADKRDLAKKFDHLAKFTFSSQSNVPLFEGFCAGTFIALTSQSYVLELI